MDFESLKSGQRYMFYYKENTNRPTMFRATFIHLFEHNQYKTLIVKKYESKVCCADTAETWYIAMELMSHYERLSDILGKGILCDDVLSEIDCYF